MYSKKKVTINYNKLHAEPSQGKTLDVILKKLKHRIVETMSSTKTSAIGVREPQPNASEAFTQFGDAHRTMEKFGIKLLKTVKPMLADLSTYLNKAVPDTKLTIKKYADAKFEYLSYCLKVKEMDDEEYSYASLQEPLYRVETGNYEYRYVSDTNFSELDCSQLIHVRGMDNHWPSFRNVCKYLCPKLPPVVETLCSEVTGSPVEIFGDG
ncbi:PREDICTED: PRKCA-binding protein-like [Priapulus caudatus]|uniref:PRKCA-binding protein-like n=1 Tax=Priapulus caudatus TaxID=37621 RepID=A0ABM1ELI5_PRICU|nr:PREDICTED: PRKCA-binding protein-like [Priapulus caudatus]